jgi:hypothetical protein
MTTWEMSEMEEELRRLINNVRNRQSDPVSVYRLSRLADLPQPMLNDFAKGRRGMTPKNIEKVLAALGKTWQFVDVQKKKTPTTRGNRG